MKSKSTTQLKRTLCMVMAVLLTFGVFFNAAFVANAAEERNSSFGGAPVASGDNWKYYSDGELVITGDIADYSATEHAPWYQYHANIRTITIQEGITSIGAYAFDQITGTSKIYIPGTVSSMSTDAFEGFALTYGYFGGDKAKFDSVFPAVNINVEINHVHSDGAIKHKKAADCKNDGYTGDTYCAACGSFIKAGELIDSTTASHTWSTTMKTKVEPTCQKVGKKGYYCTRCGAFKEDSLVNIPKTDHNWVFDGNKITTCTSANSKIVEICQNEGCTESRTVEVSAHTLLYKVTDPTCTDQGFTQVTCKYCTDKKANYKTDYKDPLGHDAAKLVTVKEVSCTEDGEYQHVCSRCGLINSVTKIKALGHDYTKEVVTKEPGCPVYKNDNTLEESGKGIKELQCSRCGDVKETTEIPNLHTPDTWSATKYVAQEPTCVRQGYYFFQCNLCGEDIYVEDADETARSQPVKEDIESTPNSHTASRWITLTEPGCEDQGLEIKKCTNEGCPYHSSGAIGEAIDYASNDTVVQALVGMVNDELANNIDSYIDDQYVALGEPEGTNDDPDVVTISTIITDHIGDRMGDFESEPFKEGDMELAVSIIDSAADALAADVKEDPTIVVTKQLVMDYLISAFEVMGDEAVAEAVASASENEIKLVASKTLDSRAIEALGHKYETVSYYRTLEDGKDVYVPVALGEDGETYYEITSYEVKTDDEGNPVYDRNGDPVYEPVVGTTAAQEPVFTGVDCNEGGVLVKQCPVCMSINSTVVAKGQHSFIVEVIKPTCTEQGYTLETCEFCTYRRPYAYKASIGHDWQTVTLKESTCTKTGLQAMQCQNCEDIDKNTYQPVATIPHDYTINKVEPNCTDKGYTQYTCKVCGGGYKDQFVDALGHDLVDTVTDVTCTKDGFTTHTCSVCGYEYKDTFVVHSGHQWGEATSVEATCTENAYDQQICTVCGEEKKSNEQPDTKLGHTWIIDFAVDVSCTRDGKTEGKHCDTCGYVEVAQQTIPATGHKVVKIKKQEATCKAAGHTAGSYCSVCGEIIEPTQVIPKKAHTPNISKASCTEDQYCTVCNTTLTKATGHSYGDWVVTKEYTAFRNGEKQKVCSKCGDIVTEKIVPNIFQRIAWIFTHFLDIILALLGKANGVFK